MYDKASIALIPSGTKTGKLYSVLPANDDGDFIFERGTTATRVNKDGLIETVSSDIPRLDYPITNGVVGDCPNLLLEPLRTNLVNYSEDFTQWIATSVTVTPNQVLAPDGTLTADKLDFSASTSARLAKVISASSGTYIFSVYLKSVSGSGDFKLALFKQGGTSTIKTVSLTEEWQRFELEYTYDGLTNLIPYVGYYIDDTYLQEVYAWGAQLEQGSYATSYIPTIGLAETRLADSCYNSGTSAEFNDSEGVLFAEIASFVSSGTSRRIAISDGAVSGGGNNRLEILYSSSTNLINFQVFSGGIFQGSRSYTVTDITDFNKVAVKYKKDDYALWINSVEVATMTSGNTPTGLNTLRFEDGSGGNDFYGKCKQLIYFNEALSDSELQTLTS